jgi:hypothetical protein
VNIDKPDVANATALTSAQRAWLAGYLAHVMTDIAYWRLVLSRLPPFPQEAGMHLGAWMLADSLPLPAPERSLDIHTVDFSAAPPWVDETAVRRLLQRMTERLLIPDGTFETELAYVRGHPESAGRSDED